MKHKHDWSDWIRPYGSTTKAYKECKICKARKFKLKVIGCDKE